MANSFDLSVNVRNANPSANIDFYYGTYESKEAACAAVPSAVRMIGKTVGIIENGSVVEYWWKSGIADEDLVLKLGYSEVIDGYTGEFTHLGSANSVSIPKETHNMGDYPVVQCYLNGRAILCNVDNDLGDLTVSWGSVGQITDNDVLTVYIGESERRFVYETGLVNEFTVPKSFHECGDNPFVQCWLDGKLTLFGLENEGGDITVSWDEDITIQDELYVTFSSDVYVGTFTNPEVGGSYTIPKATHGREKPIVECWLDGKLALFDIQNSNGDLTVTWMPDNGVSALSPLVVLVTEQKAKSVSHDIKDLVVIGEKQSGDGGITPTVDVGGISKGVFIEKDRLLNKLLRDMLTPTQYPTITPPSATIETSATDAQRLLKVGSSIQTSIWINYSQGDITLDGTVQGHTAGSATKYVFTDGVTETDNGTDNSITPVIQRDAECIVTYTGAVTFEDGDQPYDSEGHRYGDKLSGATINTSNGVAFEFVYPIYANTNIEHLSDTYEQPLVSKSRGYVEITFPLQHGGTVDRYTFEIPSSMNVTEIKYFNTFAIRYEPDNRLNDFKVVNTDKNGVPYKRYTYKNNTYMEQNTFKIIWENNI